jgi:hypothetical protein
MWTFEWRRWSLRWMGVLALSNLAVGCPCARGPVNASPALRWWLFSTFGAERICPEILKRGAPLKLDPTGPTIGRFFPDQCQHLVNEQTQTVTLSFGGTGYAWTPLAGRVGFRATAAVEYRMDFYLAEDAIYVWGKTARIVGAPEFQVGSVENKMVDWASRTPVGYMAQTFGGQIVQNQLANGFTVVRTDDGDEFALGYLAPPQRPTKPFDLSEGDRVVYANESTEVRAEQVDFLGPFEVADDEQALFFRFRLTGSPAEALVYTRQVADMWRQNLQLGAPLGPPPQQPITGFPIQPGVEQRQRLSLPRGQYYLVFDNSSRVGMVNPPWNPLNMVGASAAVLSYTVELGDADEEF